MSKTFAAYKIAIDGSGKTWGYIQGLTFEQARDENRFPLGKQQEKDGTFYIWTYGANDGRKF